ncbi:MAG: ABC transporter ATP-binding protein [Chloroflexota bacterium]|nr:ABC transporter ATP-binding protein [Chloroflexota bacterium]
MATNDGRPILELVEVTKRFGGLLAVDHVSTQVMPGQIKGIIGPNGAGKTTLYNLIMGLYEVTSGDILFKGKSIIGLKPSDIAELGITRTFQNIKLFDNMTVLENVMVGRHARTRTGFWAAALRLPLARREESIIRERAMALLEMVGLAKRAHGNATDLPFGLQRRLEIARALATEPTLLLLDEPAAGLNVTEGQELIRLIRRILDQGITVLLVEHDMDLVMDVVDEVLVLDYGRVIADAPPEAVQQDERVITAYLGSEEDQLLFG